MKKISLILITFLLIFGASGSYGYFVYIHEDDNSSSGKIVVQEELIEDEQSETSENQTDSELDRFSNSENYEVCVTKVRSSEYF